MENKEQYLTYLQRAKDNLENAANNMALAMEMETKATIRAKSVDMIQKVSTAKSYVKAKITVVGE